MAKSGMQKMKLLLVMKELLEKTDRNKTKDNNIYYCMDKIHMETSKSTQILFYIVTRQLGKKPASCFDWL